MYRIILLCIVVFVMCIIVALFVYKKFNFEKRIVKKTQIKSLGNIPLNNNNRDIMIENDPKANMMKYIRDVRNNILESKNIKTISIISCNDGEGKSWVANNLAVSMARINKRVLLIDADLRKRSNKSEIFYTETGEGLSDFIREINIEDKVGNLNKSKKYIKETQIPNLFIMENGTITVSSFELINSKKMKELLNIMKELFDYIILDGASFFDSEYAINLSISVDANILVIENKKTKYRDVIEAKEEVLENHGKILGFVLNKSNIKRGKYYSKKNKSKLGVYIETTKEESYNRKSIEEIIDNLAEEKSEKKEFDVLQKEIKDNIMIEDFINDIEVNFNTKLDSIEDNNEKNVENILNKIEESEKNLNDEMIKYINKRSEETKKYEDFYFNIKNILQSLDKEINTIKVYQQQKEFEYLKQIMEEIQEKNYDEGFNELKDLFRNHNYDEKIEDILNRIEKLEGRDGVDKELEQSKKGNIINLGKLFIDNRKKNNRVFSIDEPIKYEDLERLAIEVIEFDEIEETILRRIEN